MKNYYTTINGVTILCDENTIEGWIDFLLVTGKTVTIEKVEVA